MLDLWWSALGAVMMAWPIDRLVSREVRLGTYDQIFRERRSERTRLSSFWPVLDPVRAGLGAWLVRGALEGRPGVEALFPGASTLAWILVVLMGTLAQLPTRRDSDYIIAPVGYVAGIVAVLVPPQVAFLSLLLAAASLAAMRAWPAFFVVGAGTIAVLGVVLTPEQWLVIGAVAMVVALPVLGGLLSGRQLMFPGR